MPRLTPLTAATAHLTEDDRYPDFCSLIDQYKASFVCIASPSGNAVRTLPRGVKRVAKVSNAGHHGWLFNRTRVDIDGSGASGLGNLSPHSTINVLVLEGVSDNDESLSFSKQRLKCSIKSGPGFIWSEFIATAKNQLRVQSPVGRSRARVRNLINPDTRNTPVRDVSTRDAPVH